MASGSVTVGATATRLSTEPKDNRADASIVVKAPDATTLYIGGAGVTPADGFPVAAGSTIAAKTCTASSRPAAAPHTSSSRESDE